jgi:hypothetical protein
LPKKDRRNTDFTGVANMDNYEEAVDALMDMVGQHCSGYESHELCSGALSANRDALKFLEKIGKVKVLKEYGRMVTAVWIKEGA